MSKIIPEDRLDNILKSTDLRKLIEQTETTTARGNVICPWCHDTQSFRISEKHQSYHCFCCGRGGNAIRWMMERKGMGFREATEKLEENDEMTSTPKTNPKPMIGRKEFDTWRGL